MSMDVITATQVQALAKRSGGPWVSLYQPTHRGGGEIRQDPIRFKNLVRAAEERLLAQGRRPSEVREFLTPAGRLLEDAEFWRFQNDGLATFIAPAFFRAFRLPTTFDELVVVADRPHLKPLLALLTGDGRFHILALSQNRVRLFEGSRDRVDELDLPGVPRSLEHFLRFEVSERQLQFHTKAPGAGTGGRAAVFHGQGVGIDDSKDSILRFFRQVDRGVTDLLKPAAAPLVLAGVEYLHPIYRTANTHPGLLEQGIHGNPDLLAPEALHAQAWPIVEPHFTRARERAADRYRELAGTGRAGNELREILQAALQGRVEMLWVARGVRRWGTWDVENDEIHEHEAEQPGDEDLLNRAALETVLSGGTVHLVAPEAVPGGGTLAAVFRY